MLFLIVVAVLCIGPILLRNHLRARRDELQALKNDMDLARNILNDRY